MAGEVALAMPEQGLKELAEFYRQEGTRLLDRGLLVAAACYFERWLAGVRPGGNPNTIVPALHALACTEQLRGEHVAALMWLDQVTPHLEEGRLPMDHQVRYRLNRFVSLHRLGMDDEAYREMEIAMVQVAGIGSPHLLAAVALNRSAVCARRQDWAGMAGAAAQALELYRSLEDEQGVADALTNLGIARLELGELALARAALDEALSLPDSRGGVEASLGVGPSPRGNILVELARLDHREGKVEAALAHATQALDVQLAGVVALDKEEVAKLSELFGLIFADSGEPDLAVRYLNRAAAYFSQLGRLSEWQRVVTSLGQVLQRRRGLSQRVPRMAVPGLDFLTAVLDMTDELETVDPYIRNHSERVAALAIRMGRALGLGEREVRLLSYAGRLHDLGKVAVDAEILRKPGPLTPREWERVRVHPVIGEEMLRPFGLDEAGLLAIRHHHERWDGSGYPAGLKGEEIPLLARIIAVADVYDALTSDRVYRQAHGHWQALELLQDMAGSQLDPSLVRLLVEMHETPAG